MPSLIVYHFFNALRLSITGQKIDPIAVIQHSNSPRALFFEKFLSKRKVIDSATSWNSSCFIFRARKLDYRLLQCAKEIPADSKVWEEAIRKLEEGRSKREILSLLELHAIAESLG